MNVILHDWKRSGEKTHHPRNKVLRWSVSFLFLLVLTHLAGCAQPQPTVEIEHFTEEDGEQAYKVTITAPKKCQVFFEDEEISLDENLVGEFTLSSHDLQKGKNDLLLDCKKKKKEWELPFVIDNEYSPIKFESESEVSGKPGDNWKLEYKLTTSPDVNVLLTFGADTLWDSLPDGNVVTGSFDLTELLSEVDPDVTPDTTIHLLAILTSADNALSEEIVTKVSFPRLSLSCDYPSSKTGSKLEISGGTEPGAKVTLITLDEDGNPKGSPKTCRALTHDIGTPKRDERGLVILNSYIPKGHFVIYGSLRSLGENRFRVKASKPNYVSATQEISIYREMTDSERRQEYYRTAIKVTAKELATNHSYYIGKHVVVWGRTIEYFNETDLHCVAGGYHWVANLSGFERIPNLVGSSFSIAGVVAEESYDFITKSGSEAHAPVVNAMYYTLGY